MKRERVEQLEKQAIEEGRGGISNCDVTESAKVAAEKKRGGGRRGGGAREEGGAETKKGEARNVIEV